MSSAQLRRAFQETYYYRTMLGSALLAAVLSALLVGAVQPRPEPGERLATLFRRPAPAVVWSG